MQRPVAICLLMLSSLAAIGAEEADTPQTRAVAAKRYAAAANMPKMLDDAFKASSQNMPESQRQHFLALTKKHVRPDALEELSIIAMVKHFTTQELNAMADFYGSAEGQSALAKFGPYMADVVPLVQAEMARAVSEMRKEEKVDKSTAPSGT